jgi:hypothetical protein
MQTKPTISKKEVERLKATGHAVHVYPHTKLVCVDGFKYYQLRD